MKNYLIKPTWVILAIVLFFLFSWVSTQREQSESRDEEFYFNRGLAFINKAQYDQAISDFTKAIQIDPRLARAYSNRGLAYGTKGQHNQAITDVTKDLEINPKDDKA